MEFQEIFYSNNELVVHYNNSYFVVKKVVPEKIVKYIEKINENLEKKIFQINKNYCLKYKIYLSNSPDILYFDLYLIKINYNQIDDFITYHKIYEFYFCLNKECSIDDCDSLGDDYFSDDNFF